MISLSFGDITMFLLNENDIHEYEMDADQELNLGESGPRLKRRSLRDERGVGHEP